MPLSDGWGGSCHDEYPPVPRVCKGFTLPAKALLPTYEGQGFVPFFSRWDHPQGPSGGVGIAAGVGSFSPEPQGMAGHGNLGACCGACCGAASSIVARLISVVRALRSRARGRVLVFHVVGISGVRSRGSSAQVAATPLGNFAESAVQHITPHATHTSELTRHTIHRPPHTATCSTHHTTYNI